MKQCPQTSMSVHGKSYSKMSVKETTRQFNKLRRKQALKQKTKD